MNNVTDKYFSIVFVNKALFGLLHSDIVLDKTVFLVQFSTYFTAVLKVDKL